MSEPKNAVAKVLRDYAQKVASAGAPDRMTVADGQGGITTHKAQPPKDSGEGDLKQDLPANSTANESAPLGGSPDRMTVADGQGGISTSGGTAKKDDGEDDLKENLPTDGTTRKSAAERVIAIRAAISGANPALAPAPTGAPQQKAATTAPSTTAAPQLDLSNDVLAKIASAVLATDEGINFTYQLFEKQAGEAFARERIREAIEMADAYDYNEQTKQAALADASNKAEFIFNSLVENGVTDEHADSILKTAALHQQELAQLEHPMLKAAYAQSMDDAALMEGAEEGAGEEGVPPVDEALPMGGEELSEEDIMQLLQEMIASGEITEEDVMAALQATEGGEGGAEGAPPMPEGGEAEAAALEGAPAV